MPENQPVYRTYSTRDANPELEGPHDGVPEWLNNTLWHWAETNLTHTSTRHGRTVNVGLVHAIERNVRISLGQTDNDWELLEALQYRVNQSGDLFLDVIQAILAELDYNYTQYVARVEQLDDALRKGGSLWSAQYDADNKTAGLVRRVDHTLQALADDAVQAADDAAKLLSSAWASAFGRNPNASFAYRDSVSAAEAALWPIISPNNNKATLGTMLGDLKANPAKWTTAMSSKKTDGGVLAVVDILELLWNGQTDRHGTANPVTPTSEAAESAVSLAVTIIQWARKGGFTLK